MNVVADFYRSCPDTEEEHTRLVSNRFQLSSIEDCQGAVIFGAAQLGRKLLSSFRKMGIEIYGVCDNNQSSWGTTIDYTPIISPQELGKMPGRMVIIASRYVQDIFLQLTKMEISHIVPHYVLSVIFPKEFPNELYYGAISAIQKDREKIEKAYNLLADEQSRQLFLQLLQFRVSLSPLDLPRVDSEEYYPGAFWQLSDGEVFVDVGAFDGDTFKQFIRHTDMNFKKYIALEPDKENYQKLQQSIPEQLKDKVMLVEAGAGESTDLVAFSHTGGDDAKVIKNCTDVENYIKIVALDELCKSEVITTIKMDVEGYELEVLRGAIHTIKNHKPKLAVCVYHRPQHLWEILWEIHQYKPAYNFYLRHHWEEIYSTVLYAV